MDNPIDTESVVRIIVVIIAIFGYLYLQIRYTDSPFVKKNLKKYLLSRNLESIYKPYLSQYFTFYNSLGSEDKLLFERRVQKFIDMKEFVPRGIKEITPEMKATIAGSAIQLTFGYPNVYFRHFWRILVYPNSYYSNITHRYHMGEVDIQGMIVLSWKGFQEGFANPTDGHNLGFHEMAHALRLANIVDNDDYDFYDRDIMNEFDKEAYYESEKLRNPAFTSMFRGYFLTDRFEFFSVAVESFFERPAELKSYNPKLYSLLKLILKIDPVALYGSKEQQSIAS
jgi:MtfA peptidase